MSTYTPLKSTVEDKSDAAGSDMMATVFSSAKAASLSVEDILKEFRTDAKVGLKHDEAERRRMLHGLNEFDMVEETPLWCRYMDQVSWFMVQCGDTV